MKTAAAAFVPLIAAALAACAGSSGRGEPVVQASGISRVWCEELSQVASRRLRCDADRLECRPLESRVQLVSGCGRNARYLIFESDGIWVKIESFHERAAFDLSCPVDEIRVEQLESPRWVARGCGRHRQYELSCGADGTDCDWLSIDG